VTLAQLVLDVEARADSVVDPQTGILLLGQAVAGVVGYPPAMDLTDLNQWIKKTLPADKTIENIKSRSSTLLEMIFETSSPPYGHGTVLSSFMAYLKSSLYSHCKYSSLLEQGSGLLYRMRNIRK
jgi:hypothetical protein